MAQLLTTQIIEDVIRGIINDILIPKYDALGMRASGNWARQLEVRENQIWGERYTEQLVWGRKPGSLPPPSALAKWAEIKLGIPPSQSLSVGWAIAKTIEKEGTTWYKEGGSDLLEVLYSPDTEQYIAEKIGTFIRNQITSDLRNFIKKAF